MTEERSPLAGYMITRAIDEYTNETAPYCLTCVERDGLLFFDHTPLTSSQAVVCDDCKRLLIEDYLQHQVDEQGRLLRDWYTITEYGHVGCMDFAGHEDYQALKQLKEKTAPFYYQYVELKRKR